MQALDENGNIVGAMTSREEHLAADVRKMLLLGKSVIVSYIHPSDTFKLNGLKFKIIHVNEKTNRFVAELIGKE